MIIRLKNIGRSPVFFGIVIGCLVVLSEIILKGFNPPTAYGICFVCNTRDLIQWIIPLDLDAPEIARRFIILTIPGVILGSFISAKKNKEFKVQRSAKPVWMVLLGILVSIFGLIIMSCPTRLWLRLGFGDPLALISVVGLLLGIFLGVVTQRIIACL